MTDSNETRTAVLENNYRTMNKNIEDLSHKVDNLIEKFENFPDKLDSRYASKNTEIAVNRLMWIVISAFATALVGLVMINK